MFKFKQKITGQTGNDGTKSAEIIDPLKYLSNFYRTLEMPLINLEITIILTWSANCFITANSVHNQILTFTVTDRKIYGLVLPLATQDNSKLLEKLK